ncbi:methyl-accepting chemotaxis protein [Anaeromyxobacter sp. PSR-1]|uniref:HAMP domain-containing protein n=1 Tax=Anaeromyxobacter sp. PSR-1 TaxID=1300915 RepID=UPI0005DA6E1C|nr:methyl-accepting chemotaxis protein [Anaeromyxobacter sp. PSR-1]GAO01495.1 methyl-accepting chemotaxis protein McpS [Anaeromyxobacter sp. PSR-1]
MARHTLGVRLMLSYALPLLAVLGVGSMALERLGRVRSSFQQAAQENSTAMQLASAGLVHANETSRLIQEALLEPDPLVARTLLEAVQTNREKAHQVDSSIHAVLRTYGARAAFSSVEFACDEFGRDFGIFKERLLSGRRAEAARLVRDAILPDRRRVQAAWQDFVSWHHREIQTAAARAADQYAAARRDVLLAVVFAAVACAAAGIFMTTSVVRPVSSAVRAAQRIARGDLREQVAVTRADEIGVLQGAIAMMSARLEAVLSEIKRGAHEFATASEQIQENARWLLEHTSVQASTASEMVATLHLMGAASARALDSARGLRPLLCDTGADSRARNELTAGDHIVLRLASEDPVRLASSLLDTIADSAGELWDGVARVNRNVLSVDEIARDNALKAQDLWCTAQTLSRRAATLRRSVDFFDVRRNGPADPATTSP